MLPSKLGLVAVGPYNSYSGSEGAVKSEDLTENSITVLKISEIHNVDQIQKNALFKDLNVSMSEELPLDIAMARFCCLDKMGGWGGTSR